MLFETFDVLNRKIFKRCVT